MEKLISILVEKGKKSKIEKIAEDKFRVKLKTGEDRELLEVLSKFFGIYKERITLLSKKDKMRKVRVKLY
ncbi:hypothetical protein DRN62_03805 [Nanoarchaeota archaeon]|nr:MAG: hypothetical protein DRN62_03805 [Nanoarchaeota archaeon]